MFEELEPIVQVGLVGATMFITMATTIVMDGFLSICCRTNSNKQLRNDLDKVTSCLEIMGNKLDRIESLIYEAAESSDGEYNLK